MSKAALTAGHWKRSLTWAGSQVTPAASCPARLDASHPTPCVCVSTAGAGWLRRAGSHRQKSCPVLALLFTKAKAKGRSVPDHPPTPPPPGLAVRGRQAAPCHHPPHSPRTFRPTRNMPDVQIPQVMREFVTGERGRSRNGNLIRAASWTEAARAGQHGSGCSEQSPWEDGRAAGWSPRAAFGGGSSLTVPGEGTAETEKSGG